MAAELAGCAPGRSYPFGLRLCGWSRVTAFGGRRKLLAALIAPLTIPLRHDFSFLLLEDVAEARAISSAVSG